MKLRQSLYFKYMYSEFRKIIIHFFVWSTDFEQ